MNIGMDLRPVVAAITAMAAAVEHLATALDNRNDIDRPTGPEPAPDRSWAH